MFLTKAGPSAALSPGRIRSYCVRKHHARPTRRSREMPQRRRLGVIATLLVLLCASCTNSEEPPAN